MTIAYNGTIFANDPHRRKNVLPVTFRAINFNQNFEIEALIWLLKHQGLF